MRACNVLDALDRITLFRAQAKQTNRRVEEIGDDLNSALSLLDLGQSRHLKAVGTVGVTPGADRAVLEWSTNVIVKLSGGLLLGLPTATVFDAGAKGHQGTTQQESGERHARNAQRWLTDPRIWEAFVRSLEGSAAADHNAHLPQSAGVAVLRAAIFTVRGSGASGRVSGGSNDDSEEKSMMCASELAYRAIHTLCNGVGKREGHGSSAIKKHQRSTKRGIAVVGTEGEKEGKEDHSGGRGALLRMTLDAFGAFLEEALRGHAALFTVGGGEGGPADGVDVVTFSRAEGALTQLLRYQTTLQGHQSNRRKVLSCCCSKLMGPLFEVLPVTTGPLRSAITSVVWDALFHEEHLEGYREAFTAAEALSTATTATEDSIGVTDNGATALPTANGEHGSKKRRRKGRGGTGDGNGEGGSKGAGAVMGQRRACYQQQVLEDIARLAGAEDANTRLGATRGAPLLLEGFIVRLGRAQHKHTDIHEAAGGGLTTTSGVKRPRSAGAVTHAGAGGLSMSPASQMFKMWSVLSTALALSLSPSTVAKGWPAEPSISTDSAVTQLTMLFSPRLPFLRASNAMLQLLVKHDVYRINEDWGGREFKQLQLLAARLLNLAAEGGCRGRDGDERTGHGDDIDEAKQQQMSEQLFPLPTENVEASVAQEYVKAFLALLGLNHNILHDNLPPLFRMTFRWAVAGATEASSAAVIPVGPVDTVIARGKCETADNGSGAGGGVPLLPLRPLAVSLVVSLVDTYGRLRQMDHLVQALFGAVSDTPLASAAVLRGDECTVALGRAFQRLPEGQIESMWYVFASHLRKGWTRPLPTATTIADASAVVGGSKDELLARELDAELFVLFLRNLHVTSSIAAGLGELCSSLADESLRSFSGALRQQRKAAPTAGLTESTPSSPSGSKKKKWKKKDRESAVTSMAGASKSEGVGVLTADAMLAFRPALDIHGWLLDLDTRCRFWSAVLGSPSVASSPDSVPMIIAADPQHNDDDDDKMCDVVTAPMSDGALLRIIEVATAAFEHGRGCQARVEDEAIAGNAKRAAGVAQTEIETITAADNDDDDIGAEAEARLLQTLQQVAVHRVQKIYAHLNGTAALERGADGAEADSAEAGAVAGAESEAAALNTPEDRLEGEARRLVAFACDACEFGVRGKMWGDEDGRAKASASWRMMMPYLPVWVGFAARGQVSLFLEALFSRCAADVLARRTEEESAPLRLLTDASFYEMEAVAHCAPSVILGYIYKAVKRKLTIGSGDSDCGVEVAMVPESDSAPSLDSVVNAIQSLTSQTTERGWNTCDQGGEDQTEWEAQNGSYGDVVCGQEVEGGGGFKQRSSSAHGGGDNEDEPLLKACCLVLLTERLPAGFLDEEAMAGLMLAVDALDTICTRSLGERRGLTAAAAAAEKSSEDPRLNGTNDAGRGIERTTLIETLSSLRGLALRLGISLSPTSPLLQRFSPGDAIVRVIRSVCDDLGHSTSGGGGGGGAGGRLLRSSVNLIPFLGSCSLAVGQTKAVLRAASLLDTTGGNEDDKRSQRHGPRALQPRNGNVWGSDGKGRLVLLHGLLSGVVAGETNRLAAVAAAAAMAEGFSDGDDDASSDEDGLPSVAPTSRMWPSWSEDPGSLFGLVTRLVQLVPQATQRTVLGCGGEIATDEGYAAFSESLVLSPSLLLVWGDALRLSFLGVNTENMVFPSTETARSRSRWVEDVVVYVRARAQVVMALTNTKTGTLAGHGSEHGDECAEPSERFACCRMLRAVCGCSHLLEPPLPLDTVVALVEAFITVAVSGNGSGGGGGGGDDGGSDESQRRGELNLLHSSFCLLVQHASEDQLRAIVETLLDTLEGRRSVLDRTSGTKTKNKNGVKAGTTVGANHARGLVRQERVASATVTLVRLVTQAGRGGAFVAVTQVSALPLATALCKQLRGPAKAAYCGCTSDGDAIVGRAGERKRWLWDVAGTLEALDGLLSRHPYASVTARVVSVVLGSIEPAASAALHATESYNSKRRAKGNAGRSGGGGGHNATGGPNLVKAGGGLDSVSVLGPGTKKGTRGDDPDSESESTVGFEESVLACFRACCRLLGTVLQHYARKVYSCTPPFAALCRSLLRLFFCLAAPTGGGDAGRDGSGVGVRIGRGPRVKPTESRTAINNLVMHVSLEDQVVAASALSRVLEQFLPHKEVLKKYAAFLLLEYVSLAGSVALEPAPRAALLAGIFAVMEACTPREMRQLQGLLGGMPTGQEVFRSLFEEYQRQHKYTGKM